MNGFAFSSLLTSFLSLILAIFVFLRRSNFKLNKIWAATSFSVSLWSLGLFGVSFFDNYRYAYLSQILLDISAIFLPVLFFHFVLVLVDRYEDFNKLIKSLYLFSIVLSIFSLSDYFKKGLKPVFEFQYWVDPGPLYIVFPIFFLSVAIISIVFLFRNHGRFYGIKKQQIKYVLYSAFIGFGGGAFNFLPQFSQIYPIGNYFVVFYALAITYAIVKFRLMNIRLVLTRSILYGILVATVAAFFALSVLVVGQMIGGNTQTSKILTYVFTSFIVVVFLDPVKRTWARITDRVFYKDKIDYQALLQKLGTVVSREIDLHQLLVNVCLLLAKDLKIKQVDIFVPSDGHYELLTSSSDRQKQFNLTTAFVQYIRQNKEILIVEELLRLQSEHDANSQTYIQIESFIQEAEAIKAEMIVPVIEADKLTAIFVFQAKYSGDLYDQNDINFFKLLVPQVATAIEKSKLYEEVQKFNLELQQKVEERTETLQEVNLVLEERNRFLTTMQVISNMVSRTLDLKKINQMIVDAIASELGYVGGILSFLDKDKRILKVGAITNNALAKEAVTLLNQDPRSYESPLVENFNFGVQAVLYKKIIFSDKLSDALSPPVDKEIVDKIQDKLNIETVISVPIFSEGQVIGVISFLSPLKQEKISSIDMEIMTALSNQVGIVSSNLRLYNNLQKANRDLQDANMRLRELDKTKSEFLSIASHQLRTPISAIKGYLSMMIDGDYGKMPDSITEVLKNLLESSARLARLINVFLNVSRIESGRLKLDKKPTQIDDIIDSVIVELIKQAEQKRLKLTYKKAKKAPPLILADGDKLREVVLNLVDNSIKYTPEGKIEIFVQSSDKELTFKVKDTGIGINRQEIKSFFRKFVRGSGVAQIHTGGSGLGLFIAQKIIKEHGGNIWADSPGKGKGSSFIFTVPLYDENEELE